MRHLWTYILIMLAPLAAAAQTSDASFTQGDFTQWVENNVEFPDAALDDKVTGVCEFKINVSIKGVVSIKSITSSPHWAISDAVKAAIKKSPKWTPAKQNGKFVMQTVDCRVDMSKRLTQEQLKDMTVAEKYDLPRWKDNDAATSRRAFLEWLCSSDKKIAKEIKNTDKNFLTIKFMVGRDGKINETEVICNNFSLAQSVGKIIQSAENWQPATAAGANISCPTTISNALFLVDGNGANYEDDTPFVVVQQMPKFNDGDLNSFRAWVVSQLKYPPTMSAQGIQGRVIIDFVVERDGNTSNINVLQKPKSGEELADEAVRVVKSSPTWQPGMQRGQWVRVRYTLPVDFKFRDNPTTPSPSGRKVF